MANLKRDHGVMLDRLNRAVAGEKVEPVEGGGGPVNKKLMKAAIRLLVDWTLENRKRFLELIEPMAEIGHLTIGKATEAGAPGAHWTFNLAAILAVYNACWVSDGAQPAAFTPKELRLAGACEDVLLAECGLDRHFRFGKRVVLCCPRGKDEIEQPPYDGYRDTFLALAMGEKVKKQAKYWQDPLALAVRLMKELVDRGIWDSRLQAEARDAPMPKLAVPILRTSIENGWEARLEDTPASRIAVGRDGLTAVRVVEQPWPGKITWAYDWGPLPQGA